MTHFKVDIPAPASCNCSNHFSFNTKDNSQLVQLPFSFYGVYLA